MVGGASTGTDSTITSSAISTSKNYSTSIMAAYIRILVLIMTFCLHLQYFELLNS